MGINWQTETDFIIIYGKDKFWQYLLQCSLYLLSTTFQSTSTRHNTGVHINAVILWMWNVVGTFSGGSKIFVPQEAI
jgi:hypothetical protein